MTDYNKKEFSFLPDEWSSFEPEQSIQEETNTTEALKEEYSKDVIIDNFKSVVKFSTFPDDFLIINDVSLVNIPTTGINIQSKTDVLVAETIRTPAPVISSKGRQDFILNISLAFKPGEEQQVILKRILASLTNNPFTYIFNNRIKKALQADEFEQTIFALETGTLRSTAETVGLVILDLTFHYCNYKPFSNNFYYNGYFAGNQINSDQKTESHRTNVSLSDLVGHQSSDYVLSEYTNQTIKNLSTNFLPIEEIQKYNTPVFFPSQSPAWMYYVNNLEKDIPPITDNPSDYIGLSLKEYRTFSPPDEAKVGNSLKTANSISEWKQVVYPYKKDVKTETFQEESVNLLASPTPLPDETKFINTKTGQSLSINLFSKTGEVSDEAIYKINKFWRVGKYSDTELIKISLIKKLGKLAKKFPKKTIKIISASRNRKKQDGKLSKHNTGHAMDLRISGVPDIEVVNFLKTIPGTGVGFYPNSVFFHVDSRDTSVFWIDLSGPGEKSKYIKKAERASWFNQYLANNNTEVENDQEELTPNIDSQRDLNKQKGGVPAEVQEKIDRKNSTSAPNNDREKSLEAREAWIAEKEKQGWYLYREDSTLRNIFYKTFSFHISGNHFLQNQNIVLPNIVCSAISLTFGHRIVPLKFLGQSHPSYQFLGAGNKIGQLVLSFANEEGDSSANLIKEVISRARDNAREYGSSVKDAGTIKLSSLSFDSGEQNILLALLGFEDIVVTNLEESTSAESVDKSQLLIEFIAQKFQEEELEKKFVTTIDSKKKFVIKLISLINSRKATLNSSLSPTYTDIASFFPKRNIAKVNSGAGREYEVIPGVPSWLASTVARLSSFCQEINNKMPPISWKQNIGEGKSWQEKYAEWGAGEVFFGRVKNVSIGERNGDGNIGNSQPKNGIQGEDIFGDYLKSQEEPKDSISYDDMYRGIFEFNGSPDTNNTHNDIFREWLQGMEFFVREVSSHMADEENFEKYFGSIGKEMMNSVLQSSSNCYKDLNLPTVPGTEVQLPPEFYIYDDSDEDPLVSNMTDQSNLVSQIEQHTIQEFESIKHFMKDSYLGGSYLSKNLPRILENRAIAEKDFLDTELEHIDDYSALFRSGFNEWEPIYYKKDERLDSDSGVQIWKNEIKKNLGGGSIEDQKLNFMSDLLKLNSYITEGRKWETPYNEDDKQSLVESAYGEAWNNITFGPNTDYLAVDSVLSGHPLDPSFLTEKAKHLEEAAKKKAKSNQKNIELPGERTVTTFGAVTVGSLNEIEEIEEVEDSRSISEYLVQIFDLNTPEKNRTSLSNANIDIEHPAQQEINKENVPLSIAKTAAGIALGQKKDDLSFRRAYPTLKIYLIEDDSKDTESIEGRTLRAFDDFYSYSSIQEVRITRSRKIPADLATIRITNIGGKLLRKRFGQEDKEEKETEVERQGIFADTELENPFENMVLQDGVKIQIRLGYSNNSEYLETVFLGQIVETSLREEGKIIEIVCQGYGAELESLELGPLEDGPVFYSSQQVLSGAIIQESIVNFGRQDKHNRFNPAEVRHAWTGGNGKGILGTLSIGNLISSWADNQLGHLFNSYTFLNAPQDDNIFAPPPSIYATDWDKFWNNACLYRPIKQTPWQIFKEHELRHPGYISLAVPYGHSPRMTMFFGSKAQHYWKRPPSAFEVFVTENMKNSIISLKNNLGFGFFQKSITENLSRLSVESPSLANALASDLLSGSYPNEVNQNLGKLFGRYVPFRNFHFLDSTHHILKNEIRTSVDGTFNEVEIYYADDEDIFDKGTIWSPIGHLIGVTDEAVETEAERLSDGLQKISNGESGVFTVKLDENIPESSIRSYREEFPSCVTDTMAKRYSQGIFARHLRDAYKGDLVVAGKETIKPYDIISLHDYVSQMIGPIEVEAVTHVFNQDVGFVSIITPDLCVEVNDMYTTSSIDMTLSAMSYVWPITDSHIFRAALPGVFGLGVLAMSAGVKFVSWTQDGDPVLAMPLTLGGKPFLSVSLGHKNTSLFLSLGGQWKQYWDDLEDAWNKFDLGEAFFDLNLSISEKLLSGLGSGGVSGGVV